MARAAIRSVVALLSAALVWSHTSPGRLPPEKLVQLQKILDAKAVQWNTSFSVGLYSDAIGLVGVAAGPNDRTVPDSQVTTRSRFPVGSVTKPFTAAAILQLHDAGYLDIDDPVAGYVDPVLQRLNGTTMLQLFNGDTTCLKVTFRMLMGMRGGLHDYNDTWYEDITVLDGWHDVGPFELLHRLNKTWACEPGTCGVYASTGFELLGLALVQAAGVEHWEDYDQFSVIPPDLRDTYKDIAFPGKGPCSNDPLIIHQYGSVESVRKAKSRLNLTSTFNLTIYDLYNDSCLNGWTCGNIAAAPSNIAKFHYDLHHGRIVSNESLAAMMAYIPTNKGWSPQEYGLATMMSWPLGGKSWLPDPQNISFTVGHAGADYGSLGMLAGYNWKYKFGIALFSGSAMNLNCSLPANMTVGSDLFFTDTLCAVYDEVLVVVTDGTAPRLNCSACPPGDVYCYKTVVEPSCQAFFNTTRCGQNRTIASNWYLCEKCVFPYEHDAKAACHSKYGLRTNCPMIHRNEPSPPVACDWSNVF